jgi:hypothetical protein
MAKKGTLGKALTTAAAYVTVYTVPMTAEFATITISGCNGTNGDATFRLAITDQASEAPQDHLEYGAAIPANGGVYERTCLPVSPGEKVMIWCDRAGVAFRVSGLEQDAA